MNTPVWLKEKQSANKPNQRSLVNIARKKSGSVGKTKRTKNEKFCFELFTSENMLKTIVEFTNKTMKKLRNKRELAIDYRTMDTNIDEIRCLIPVLVFTGNYHDTKEILDEL